MSEIWIISATRYGHERLKSVLDGEVDRRGAPRLVVLGDGTGGDVQAFDWCRDRGIAYELCEADWGSHGLGGGPRRNARMVRKASRDRKRGEFIRCYGFPDIDSIGTWDLLAQALGKGISPVQYYSLRYEKLVETESEQFCLEQKLRAKKRRTG